MAIRSFNKTYHNWPLHDAEHLMLVEVESHGSDLKELVGNARLYIHTWHGGEGPSYDMGDLHERDYQALLEEFKNHLDYEMECFQTSD